MEGEYVFFNNTTGSHTLTIAATGHAANGIAIAQGAYSHVYNDGTANYKMYNAVDKLGATTFKGDVTAGDSGEIILRGNGAVTATTFVGSGANLTGVDPFPSGTKQVFYQASAPTGWTKDTTAALNEAVMSVVTGTGGGTGGSTAFFSSFLATTDKTAAQGSAPVTGSVSVSASIGATTLSTPQIPSHSHPVRRSAGMSGTGGFEAQPQISGQAPGYIGDTGGGGSHTHPFSVSSASLTSASADVDATVPAADVKYANVIIAAKRLVISIKDNFSKLN